MRGFTLIELLVVVAILGILVAISTPLYQGYQLRAKINGTKIAHENLVQYLSTEFFNCSAGAGTFNIFSGPGISVICTMIAATDAAAIQAAAAFNFGANGENWTNPHNNNQAAVVSGAAPVSPVAGRHYITVAGQTITITTLADPGGAALVNSIFVE